MLFEVDQYHRLLEETCALHYLDHHHHHHYHHHYHHRHHHHHGQTSITDRCPEETHVRHLDQPHNLKTLTIALFGESVFSKRIPTI